MKLYKQVKKGSPAYKTAVWWTDFSINGQRFRIGLDTTNKNEATALAHDKFAQAKQGKLSAKSQSFARLTLNEAAEKYLASRRLELQASSLTKKLNCL